MTLLGWWWGLNHRKSYATPLYRWTCRLQRVMLSSHLLPHFYSYSHCKGHVKQMIKRRVPNTFVTDDVEACIFFFLLFQVPHAHFSTLVIYEMATLAHGTSNGTQKISRQLMYSYGIVWIWMGWQQEPSKLFSSQIKHALHYDPLL